MLISAFVFVSIVFYMFASVGINTKTSATGSNSISRHMAVVNFLSSIGVSTSISVNVNRCVSGQH